MIPKKPAPYLLRGGYRFSEKIILPDRLSEHEKQQQRDQQREDAERFREREAEEQRVALAAGRRWVAQRAGQELAEHVGDADRGRPHADAGKARAGVFRCHWIHHEAPLAIGWIRGRVSRAFSATGGGNR